MTLAGASKSQTARQDTATFASPENPKLLPEKSARTSVVVVLQQLHNLQALILNRLMSPLMQCEQRANYILDCHLPVAKATPHTRRSVVERRAKPRSSDALPARVWGVDINDHPFSFDCLLDNMSASGLYLRMPRRMKFSASISLVVRLPYGPLEGKLAAIKGTVIRDEMEADGHTGLGIRIIEHSFI
jgi:hypothetical protein